MAWSCDCTWMIDSSWPWTMVRSMSDSSAAYAADFSVMRCATGTGIAKKVTSVSATQDCWCNSGSKDSTAKMRWSHLSALSLTCSWKMSANQPGGVRRWASRGARGSFAVPRWCAVHRTMHLAREGIVVDMALLEQVVVECH